MACDLIVLTPARAEEATTDPEIKEASSNHREEHGSAKSASGEAPAA
jgi:hypothetical protein